MKGYKKRANQELLSDPYSDYSSWQRNRKEKLGKPCLGFQSDSEYQSIKVQNDNHSQRRGDKSELIRSSNLLS